MGKEFFEIVSPRDLLEKAKRDYEKIKIDTSTDTIFNFFVTAYHIVDYVRALGTVAQTEIDKLYLDTDFRMCQFLCNKGKHIQLRGNEPYEAKHVPAIQGGVLGSFVLGVDRLGGPEKFVIVDGTQEFDVIKVGNNLIMKWEDFFLSHGIS